MAIRKTFKEGSDFANLLPKIERESFIDIAKIIAVVLMVVTHVIGITYDYSKGTDTLVYYIGLIGGISSFTAFLFLSGINYYYSSVKEFETKNEDYTNLQKRLFYRAIQIGLVYIILALIYFFVFNRVYSGIYSPTNLLRDFYNTFTIGPLPEYSEYLITIAIFIFAGIIFGEVYKWISKTQWRALLSGTFLFFVGYIGFNIISGPARLNTLTAIIFGKTFDGLRIHTFPVLQYSMIFFLGLWFGHFVKNYLNKRTRFKAISLFSGFSLVVTICCLIAYTAKPLDIFYPLPLEGRFPPSIGFIALSLFITSLVVMISMVISKVLNGKLQKLIQFLARNSLGLLAWHLILLFGYRYLLDTGKTNFRSLNIVEVLAFSIVIFLLTSVITFIYNFIVYTIIEVKLKKEFDFLVHIIIPLFILVFTFCGSIYLVFNRVSAYSRGISDNVDSYKKVITLPKQDPFWANDDYKFKRQITINNDTQSTLFETNYITVIFDHAKAVGEKKSLDISGKDIRIVYWNKSTNIFEELQFAIENPNNSSTKLIFKLKKDIAIGIKDLDYYIYYGNTFVKDSPKLELAQSFDTSIASITVGDEMVHRLQLDINREWFVLKPETKELENNLTGEIILPDNVVAGKYYISYQVLNSADQIITSKDVPTQDGNKYSISPDIAGLGPAVYKLQAQLISFDKNLEILTTYKTPFRITYPLYVTWSFDWDGWGVSDYGLSEINYVANRYSMPITQLFNPRIYVKNQTSFPSDVVTVERAGYLTSWVLTRKQQYGDEIGMHLHMFPDMVSEAGVTPRPGTVVGAMYGDAKTSDFTQAELEIVMGWGFEKFAEAGLPKPITYRAGGWFTSPSVLAAAQASGFLIDTSGRTGGRINPTLNYSTEVPWSLQPTTAPYLPSVGDMNKWESPRLSLWEFPDNGADSYWFSAEDLISRFQQNMPGTDGVLTHPQVLTYLTHPHWFTIIDEPKVKSLFDYIGNFKYESNSGPVIYTTLEKAYNDWDKTNDINGVP
ncbi:MAG: acyltransferase family protein [Candidatus Dojkabacteria bacterium]